MAVAHNLRTLTRVRAMKEREFYCCLDLFNKFLRTINYINLNNDLLW
jgi:hypothetical protein